MTSTPAKSHKVAFYADIFYDSELSPAYWTPPANLDVDVILLGGDIHYAPERLQYAVDRYVNETNRLYGVLNKRLADREFVADQYSIADIAIWPWVSRYEWQTVDLNQYPNVKRWYVTIAGRPAVQRGYHVPKKVQEIPMP